jgi:hypothetical protein
MRWPHESAVARRNEHLARTRKLSLWIAGGATAASLGLAAALGVSLPGHTATTASQSGSTATSGSSGSASGNKGAGPDTGTSNTGANTGSHHAHHHAAIAPPKQAPAHTKAPPVVSSGGS